MRRRVPCTHSEAGKKVASRVVHPAIVQTVDGTSVVANATAVWTPDLPPTIEDTLNAAVRPPDTDRSSRARALSPSCAKTPASYEQRPVPQPAVEHDTLVAPRGQRRCRHRPVHEVQAARAGVLVEAERQLEAAGLQTRRSELPVVHVGVAPRPRIGQFTRDFEVEDLPEAAPDAHALLLDVGTASRCRRFHLGAGGINLEASAKVDAQPIAEGEGRPIRPREVDRRPRLGGVAGLYIGPGRFLAETIGWCCRRQREDEQHGVRNGRWHMDSITGGAGSLDVRPHAWFVTKVLRTG